MTKYIWRNYDPQSGFTVPAMPIEADPAEQNNKVDEYRAKEIKVEIDTIILLKLNLVCTMWWPFLKNPGTIVESSQYKDTLVSGCHGYPMPLPVHEWCRNLSKSTQNSRNQIKVQNVWEGEPFCGQTAFLVQQCGHLHCQYFSSASASQYWIEVVSAHDKHLSLESPWLALTSFWTLLHLEKLWLTLLSLLACRMV